MREKHAAVHILDSRLRGNDGEEREQVVNGYLSTNTLWEAGHASGGCVFRSRSSSDKLHTAPRSTKSWTDIPTSKPKISSRPSSMPIWSLDTSASPTQLNKVRHERPKLRLFLVLQAETTPAFSPGGTQG